MQKYALADLKFRWPWWWWSSERNRVAALENRPICAGFPATLTTLLKREETQQRDEARNELLQTSSPPFRYTSFPTLFSFFEPWRYARVHLPQSYAIAIPDRKVNLRRAHFARRSSYLLVMYVMYCESLMFPETSSLSPRIVIVPYREGNASWTSLFLRVLRFLSPFSHLPEIRTRHRFSPRIASARFYR